MSLSYESPLPHDFHNLQAAYVANAIRQRSLSGDAAPVAKRHRANSTSTSTSTSGSQRHAPRLSLDPSAWSSSRTGSTGAPSPPPSRDRRMPESSVGASAHSYLPTPPSVRSSSFTTSPRVAPQPTRSNSQPHSLTAKALALTTNSGGFIGHPREWRTGGVVEVPHDDASALLESAMPERRQTDPGVFPRAVETPSEILARTLVDASVIAIESIWGPQEELEDTLTLDYFVREILRRSRTSCSTLQVALFYLHKLRREFRSLIAKEETSPGTIHSAGLTSEESAASGYPSPPHTPVEAAASMPAASALKSHARNPLLCGRRMFLAALICASKFLQDRNYSNKAWAKIAGLDVEELSRNERVFLLLIKYDLFLGADDFKKWTERLADLKTMPLQCPTVTPATSYKAVPSSTRQPIERRASEYPPAPPLAEMRAADPNMPSSIAAALLTRPTQQRGSLTRSSSHPDISSRRAESFLPKLSSAPIRRSTLHQASTPLMTGGLASPPLSDDSEEEHSPLRSGHPLGLPLPSARPASRSGRSLRG